MRVSFIKSAILVILLNILFIPPIVKYEPDGDNLFILYLNGEEVGTVGSLDKVNELMADARRMVGRDSDSIVYLESDLEIEPRHALFAKVDSDHTVRENMADVMRGDVSEVLLSCYTMRIGDITVNLPDSDSVREVLQAALDAYDTKGQYKAELVVDPNRELNALTVNVVTDEEAIQTAKDLARLEGLMCGISSGTNVAAARKLAKKLGKGKTVVTILPDTAERYFSTPLFE